MAVKSDVERVIKDFHGAKKPIGLCCIAPILAAKVLGPVGVELTLGKTGKSGLFLSRFSVFRKSVNEVDSIQCSVKKWTLYNAASL